MLLRLAFAFFAATTTLAAAPTRTGQAEEPPPRLVRSEVVRFEPMRSDRTLVGTVRARYETDYGFRVAGKIAARSVQVGERVMAGQELARLDDADLRLQREQALAELEAARSAERQAAAEEKRVEDLRKRGWSTESIFDRQRALADEAEGRRKRAERAVALAGNALGYAVLTADADGVVTAVTAEPGQVVAAGQAVLRVALVGAREAVVAVPEAEIDRVRAGKASVRLWNDPDRAYPAALRELSPSADPLTRTYQARFTIEGIAADAPLGMTATVTITEASTDVVTRLPLSALFNQGSGDAVFVVDPENSTLVMRSVSVRGYEGRSVVIARGLSEGERVVTLGVHMLQDGQKVKTALKAR